MLQVIMPVNGRCCRKDIMFEEHTVLLALYFGSLRHDSILNVSLPLRGPKEKKPLCLHFSEVKRHVTMEELGCNELRKQQITRS